MLTQEMLHKEMVYREGKLYWKRPAQGRRRDGSAGGVDKEGYVRINLFRTMQFEHRLVWLYFNGSLPEGQLDHINRRPADNRIDNLRLSTTRENNLNKDQSDRVLPHNIYRDWAGYRVDIQYRGCRYRSKTLKTVEEALLARDALLQEAGLGE